MDAADCYYQTVIFSDCFVFVVSFFCDFTMKDVLSARDDIVATDHISIISTPAEDNDRFWLRSCVFELYACKLRGNNLALVWLD